MHEKKGNGTMVTYKLFRIKEGKLFPLYVLATKELEMGKWLHAEVGEPKDATHVKSRLGALALRPGFHSAEVPFTDWIGKRMPDGSLWQKPGTVWCECQVRGERLPDMGRNGLRTVPDGWYYFRTQAKQPFPWIISGEIKINRILGQEEVSALCRAHGLEAQPVAV